MTLPLNPEMVAAGYEYLRTTPPFKGLRLPPSDAIIFRITRNPHKFGHYRRNYDEKREIATSTRCIGSTAKLLETLAHEMIHLHEDLIGLLYKSDTAHSATFRRLAKRACRHHGWDLRAFY